MNSAVTGVNRPRMFPRVGPRLHEPEPPDQEASRPGTDQLLGRALLKLGRRRFNLLQRWRGVGLDPAGRAGRLFLFHRLAMEAELGGNLERADFFWRETHRQAARLALDAEFWPAVLNSLPEAPDSPLRDEPDMLPRIIASEILLDTHRAVMRGYLEESPQPESNSRAFMHLGYARNCLELTGLDATDREAILGSATLLEIEANERARAWKRAEALAADLLRRFPEGTSYQNALAATYLAQARGTLKNGDTPPAHIKDAVVLARFLYRLKKLRLDYPHNLFIFECIANLHHLRAEKLAAAGQLAEALADVQAALTYQPDFAEAEETRARLEAEVQQVRVQMAAPADERPTVSKRQLKTMQRLAATGFRLMESYKRSEEANAAEEDLTVARGRRIWEGVGLEPLGRIDHRPLALIDAFETISHAPPVEPAGLPAAWSLVSDDNPYLASLDAERVYSYLNQRLYGGGTGAVDDVVHEVPAACDEAEETVPEPLRPAAPRRGREPFFYWAASGENKWLKLQCALALVLVLVGGRLALREYSHRSTRAVAYHQLQLARAKQDYIAMLDAAETFLGNPINGSDSRDTEVEGLYSEALLRWFVREQPSADSAATRLERYRQLLGTRPTVDTRPAASEF